MRTNRPQGPSLILMTLSAPTRTPAPRLSTAVILTRGHGEELEVFLARRNPRLRFFGGFWALPGGVIDDADVVGERDGDATHRRCALRELFEELGVLPEGFDLPDEERRRLRDALLEDEMPAEWSTLVEGAGRQLSAFQPVGRLTTPPFAPLRYRTRFLHLELPAGEEPEIIPGELMEGRFFRPAELLETWRSGGFPVVPPALVMAELFGGDLHSWLAAIGERTRISEEGRQHAIRITPGVAVLPLRTPTLPPATTTNCYVLGNERLYVVDPATYEEEERERLFDFLDDRLAEGCQIEGVIVTHHHHDHVGSVAAVAERHSLPVFAHPLTLERLPEPVARPVPIEDGHEFDLGQAPDGSTDWKLVAHHTPGHDRGHMALQDSRYRALIAGDLLSTVSTIIIDPPEGHLATYLQSLERMLEQKITTLHPAHGPGIWGGEKLLRRYLAHREMREESLLRGLGKGLSTIGQLVPFVYADTDESMYGVASRSLLAGLEKLVEEGRARIPAEGCWELVRG